MKPDSLDADALARAVWFRGLTPDPTLTVSEWADKHRVLAGRVAAEPGPYRTDRTPYLREIMDALSVGSPEQRIVFMKSAQVGATEAGNNWIGYLIHHAPAPMMAVMPTVELAKRNSKQRIDPLIETSPELRERVAAARTRDSGNTILSKEFPGGVLVMTGANSAVGLRFMSARFLFLDEVDGYPDSAGDEGDPVTLVSVRSQTFGHRSKAFLVSTPTIKGQSRIERAYEASDQRRYFVPCPHCGHMQWLQFDRLRWEKGRPDTAEYLCEECDKAIGEDHKGRMLDGGEWRATAESQDEHSIGFHISSLYSPPGWKSWSDIARGWESAQGSDHELRVFKNTVLGETWFETGDAPDWQRIVDQREIWDHGTIPPGGVFLTAGADVQKDRIEVDVWAWGRGLESWLVDHIVIDGGPNDPNCWDRMTAILGQTWADEHGECHLISRLCIDTGYETPMVYSWARSVGFSRVSPVKGASSFERSNPVIGPSFVDTNISGKRVKRGARLWSVATSTFKSETYRLLKQVRPTKEEMGAGAAVPNGTIHIPYWADDEWIKQLTAEQLVTIKTKRGFTKLEWQKLRARNEALDLRVYARAAVWIMGADRWSDEKWIQMGWSPPEAGDAIIEWQSNPRHVPATPTPMTRRKDRPDDWINAGDDWI